MEKTITIAEAIEQGYTCALSEDGEYFTKLEDADEDLFNYYTLYLGTKETFKFSISERAVKDLLERYIEGQDEVNNEDDQLYDQIKKVDYVKICELINPVFTTDYHWVTDIRLVSIEAKSALSKAGGE